MDLHFLQHPADQPVAAMKRHLSEGLSLGSCRSFDSSPAELSASVSSIASAAAEGPHACDTRLIPTPSMPSSRLADSGGVCESSSGFTNAEVLSILKAEKLVGQLRHRFDTQPARFADVQHWMRQWLEHEISTGDLHSRVARELAGDHPDDSAILESFRWFVDGSLEFHEQASASPSPRCGGGGSGGAGALLRGSGRLGSSAEMAGASPKSLADSPVPLCLHSSAESAARGGAFSRSGSLGLLH